ncbi:hypothetical protein A7A09_011305 [Paracoccus methylarcula]|uniref:Uncharacterized protein n=1 Tax=Paracoccus methylarcula TaxID=72022 RepID=A0A422QWX2_9RHOB|nr:hypothetical protein A7A09_011305 [Paracoccus methylarcula]
MRLTPLASAFRSKRSISRVTCSISGATCNSTSPVRRRPKRISRLAAEASKGLADDAAPRSRTFRASCRAIRGA